MLLLTACTVPSQVDINLKVEDNIQCEITDSKIWKDTRVSIDLHCFRPKQVPIIVH